MKKFSIFEHPDRRLEALKQGFSIPGLLAGGLWLLRHGVWLFGTIATVAGLGVYALFPRPAGYLYEIPYGYRFGLADVLNLGICVFVGLLGNKWRVASLLERGFEQVWTEQAATVNCAKGA